MHAVAVVKAWPVRDTEQRQSPCSTTSDYVYSANKTTTDIKNPPLADLREEETRWGEWVLINRRKRESGRSNGGEW